MMLHHLIPPDIRTSSTGHFAAACGEEEVANDSIAVRGTITFKKSPALNPLLSVMSKLPSARPSFFEVYAAEQLDSALRPAFRYVLEVVSIRNPSLLRLANWSDELFSFLLLILETFQLSTEAALLSESFYSLRRSASDSFEPNVYNRPLSPRQVLSSVFYAVIMPHVRAKLDNWHSVQTGGAAAAMLQELHLSQPQIQESGPDNRRPRTSRSAQSLSLEVQRTTRSKLTIALRVLLRLPTVPIGFIKAFIRYAKSETFKRQVTIYYPKIRAVVDAINLIFGISYLYGHSKYFNLSLALQGLILRRVSAMDLLRLSAVVLDSSGRPTATSLHGIRNFLGRMMSVLRIAFFASIFGFRFLQYYYAAEAAAPRDLGAVIPPPAPLEPAAGVNSELAMASGKCPICHQDRTNPTACTTSGYVFCYLCIVSSLQTSQKCPVTLAPATMDDLVRVYENSGDS